MKKNWKSGKAFGFVVLLLLALAACTSRTDHAKHGGSTAATAYQCPMKCESEKTYPQPGSCPVCKMDSATVYTCPMHAEIVRSKPGSCPICKMDLVVKKKE